MKLSIGLSHTALVAFLLSLLHISTSLSDDEALNRLKRARRVRRLIGGMDVPEGRWPWLIQLHGKVATHFIWSIPYRWTSLYCTGTVIDANWILTAAHCFKMSGHPERAMIPKYWHVQAGEVDSSPSIGARIKSWFGIDRIIKYHADKIILHPRYNERNSWENDLALVKLRKSLPLSSDPNIGAVPLPPYNTSNVWPQDEAKCYMKGFGCEERGRGISETAQMAEMPKMNDRQCISRFGSLDLSTRLCAGFINAGVGICSGDSGGPLVCELNGTWALGGIASFTSANSPGDFPGVFTRVNVFTKWIRNTIILN